MGTGDSDEDVSVDPSASLEASWDAGSGSGDVVYVDVVPAGSDAATLRCSFADSAGHGAIPASAWASLAGATDGQLGFHRVHRETSASAALKLLLLPSCAIKVRAG